MLTDGGMHVTCMAAATESACIAQSYTPPSMAHIVSCLSAPPYIAIAVLHILDIVLVNYIHVRLGENLKR